MRGDAPKGFFRRVAALITRRPRIVLAVWLVLIGAAVPLASRVGDVLVAEARLGDTSEAVRVSRLVAEQFGGADAGAVILVLSPEEDSAVSFAEARDAYLDALTATTGVAHVQDLRDLLPASPAGERFLGQIAFGDASPQVARSAVLEARELAGAMPGVQADLAGGMATALELEEVSERDTLRAELFGLPLSLLVLVVAFGALLASFLPLLVAATTISVSLAVVWLLGQLFPFAIFTQSIVTMLGLATGIDYALLMVSRFREELRSGRASREAAEVTAATAGKAVAFSGLTVMVALSALLVPPLPYIRSVGVGTLVVLLVSVLVSWTALPALLTLLGDRVNWLKVTRRTPGTRTREFWRTRAHGIMRRPWLFTILGTLALVVLGLPALRMQLADPGPLGLASGTESRATVAALEEAGLGGLLASTTVLVDAGEDGFFGPTTPRRISRLVRDIEALPTASLVLSPFSAVAVPRLFLFQYYVDEELARGSDVAPLVEATVGEDGRTVQLRVLPPRELAPLESAALARGIRAAAEDAGLAVEVGGSAVFEAEWSRTLYGTFPVALGIVFLATLILLGLAFRSVLIPIKAIVLNTLTVAASYGVITLIFQMGFGARLFGLESGLGFIDSNVPLFVFAIVFGLSMDYEVFLVARIFEAHERGLSDREAVASALSATGGVITSAAAVMLVVFSVFFFSDVVLIKTLGVGLAVAIFLDATLVRLALVPAVMTLAGDMNWWLPKPLARLADRIDISH